MRHEAQFLYLDNLQKYLRVALLAYDILLNIDKEVQAIWKRKFSSASVLYLAFRVIPFLRMLLAIVVAFGPQIPSVSSLHPLGLHSLH